MTGVDIDPRMRMGRINPELGGEEYSMAEPGVQDQPGVQPVQEAFKWPTPDFIPQLIARAPRGRSTLEKEQWTKEVKQAMDAYFALVDQENLKHMANQGRMKEYIQAQAQDAAGLDDKAKLAMFDKSIDLTDNRNPQAVEGQNKFLAPYLASADENLVKEASRIAAYRDERAAFARRSEMDITHITEQLKRTMEAEKERWITRGGVSSAINALTLGPVAGNPRERILAEAGDLADFAANVWAEKHARSPNKERYGDPETYRRFLRAQSLNAIAKDINDPKLEEGFFEGAIRHLGGLATPFVGAKAIEAIKLIKAAPKVQKLLTVGTAGGIGAAIYAHGADEAQRAAIDEEAAKNNWTKEQRERALHDASVLNGVMGATFLPAMSWAMKLGATNPSVVKRIVIPAAGLVATGEAHTKAYTWMRDLAEKVAKDDSELQNHLDMLMLTHPKAAGAIERLVFSPVEEKWQAAKDFAQQLLPNMVFFGGIQAVRAAAPGLVNRIVKREDLAKAKAEAEEQMTGGAKDMALRDLAEMEAQLPKPTAKEKLVERVGPERAEEEIRGDLERERRMRAAEPVAKAAEDTEMAESMRLAARERRMRAEEPVGRAAEDEEIRVARKPELSPEQEDASAYRQMAERATGEEAVALRDVARMHEQRAEDLAAGKEPMAVPEAIQRAAQTRQDQALAEATEAPKLEEQAAKRLLEGGLEAKELEQRAAEIDTKVGEALVGTTLPEVPGKPQPTGVAQRTTLQLPIERGDVLNTAHGEIVVESATPELVTARDVEGGLVTRTPQELVQEAPKLVGRRRKMAEKLAAQRAAAKAAKEESRQQRIERAAHEAQRGTPEQKAQAKRKMTKEIVENDAEIAKADAEARKAKAADVDAPPPGEDDIPEPMARSVRFVDKVRESGVLKRLAESEDWSKLRPTSADNDESRSVLATAKQRNQFYPDSLKGPDRSAQALYDHLRISEGLPPSAETIKVSISRLNADLKTMEKFKGSHLWQALQTVMERHHDFIKGPWAHAARMMPDGIAAMNRLEDAIARANGEVIKKPSERGAALVPGSEDIEQASRILKLVRAAWPWSTHHGLNPNVFSMSPRVTVDLSNEITRNYMRDPATDLAGQPFLERWMQKMGLNFGAPEVKFGRIGVAAARMFSEVQAQQTKFLNDVAHPETGLVTRLDMDQRRKMYDLVGGHDPSEWAKVETDKKVLDRAPKMKEINDHLKKILWESSSTKYHLEQDVRLLKEQVARAATMQEMAKGKGQFIADQRAKDLLRKLRTAERKLATEEKEWAVRNYVHRVYEGQILTGSDFGVVMHRKPKEALEAADLEPIHDAFASVVDGGTKSIAVAIKNRFIRDNYEFFNGKLRMVEWNDITQSSPKRRTKAAYDGKDVEILGEHYVLEGGDGKRQLFPTLKKEGGEWKEAEAPEGAKRMVVLAPWKPKETYGAKREDNSAEWTVLHPNDAMLQVTIRDGGWFDRASPRQARSMQEFLDKAYKGIDELRLNQTPAQNIVAAIGRFSTKMAMTSPGTAVNIAVGGSLMNTLHMAPGTQILATRQVGTMAWRRWSKGLGETLPGVEPGTPEWDVGRRSLRSTPEELKRMSPQKAAEQLMWDDAMVDATGSGILEHTMVDLEKKFNLPKGDGGEPLSPEAVRKAAGWKKWDYVLAHVRGADTFARLQNYLGVNFDARKAGLSRKEAHEKAVTSVMFNHGLFNALTQSPLLASTFGQFFLGLKTYLARQMMIWAAAPAEYKMKYASLVIATNYIWQQMGMGDLTSTLMTSVWDIPFADDYVADLVLGGEEPLGPDFIVRPGSIPVQTPLSSSPMIQATGTALQAIKAARQGDMNKFAAMSARALDQAFVPALFKMVNRMQAKPNEEGTYDAISIPQRVAGDERTSYTLKQTGLHQAFLDILPGTQMDVQRSIEQRRIKDAQERALEGARAGVRSGIRGLVRRYDEATSTGTMTEQQEKETNTEFEKLAERGRGLGLNLLDADVRKRVLREERRNILIDKLPPELRQIAKGSSKESKVRMLTDALNSGISEQRLGVLRDVISPGKSLRTWAFDEESVSESTAKKFLEAADRWTAKQAQQSSQPRAAAR